MSAKATTTTSAGSSVGDDVRAVRELIEWARGERLILARVRVGAVEIEIAADAGGSAEYKRPTAAELAEASRGLYEQFGGSLFAEAVARSRGGEADRDDGDEL